MVPFSFQVKMVAGSFDKFSSVTDIRFEQMNLPPNNHVPIVYGSLFSRGTLPFSFLSLAIIMHTEFQHLICIFQFGLIGSSSYIFYL